MAIYLTTGKPGSYKTASTIEHAQKILKEGRLVYFCNFRGLKAQENGFNILDHFDQWESMPDGSVLFVDEVQEFTRDVKTAAKTEELPQWFTKLEKHRHRGIDIYLNTQHPMFIHTHIRRLVEKHTHLQRTQGLPFAIKRQWGQVVDQPEDIKNASIKSGCTTEMYKPSKSVFLLYESTVLDTHKFQFPTKLIKAGLLLTGLIGFTVWLGLPVAQKYLNFGGDKQIAQKQAQDTTQPLTMADRAAQQAALAKLTPEQYADLMDPEKRNSDLQASNPVDMDTIVLKYNPNKPYNDFSQQLRYEPTSFPVFSGCMKKNGRYYGYTQQGTLLDVSQEDCRKLLEDGNRPFNYFSDRSELVSTESKRSADSTEPEKASFRF
jgi:uncharacterized protein YpiB (UPF0302 family)